MNSHRSLPEHSHDQCIRYIDSRELDVVHEFVGRNALENEVAGISVLAFITFQGNGQKPDPHRYYENHDQP